MTGAGTGLNTGCADGEGVLALGLRVASPYDADMLNLIQGGGDCFRQVVICGKIIYSLIQILFMDPNVC